MISRRRAGDPASEGPSAGGTGGLAAGAPRTGPGDVSAFAPGLTPRDTERLRRKMGRTGRYPLVLLTLVFALNVAHTSMLPAVFPLIKVEFQLSDTALGLLGSSFLLFASLGLVPFAVAADRYSRTRIIAWATLLWGALVLLMSTAGSYMRLFAARTMLGITDPAEQPTSYSLLADYYQVEERGRIYAIWNIGQLMGIVLVPVGGVLADVYGWRAALNFFAIPAFVLGLAVWRLEEPVRGGTDRLHEARLRAQAEGRPAWTAIDDVAAPAEVIVDGDSDGDDGTEAGVDLSAESIKDAVAGYARILRIKTLLVALTAIGFTAFFSRGLGVWLAVFFVRFHDMSLAQATGTVALLALGALVGSLLGGFVGDYLVNVRQIRTGRVRLAGASSIAASVFLFAAFSTDHTIIMMVLFFIGAVLVFPPQPLLQAEIANVVHPDLRGRGASLDTLTQTVFGATSIFLYGVLSDSIGLRSTLLTVVPLVALGGIVVSILAPRFLEPDAERVRQQLEDEAAAADLVAGRS